MKRLLFPLALGLLLLHTLALRAQPPASYSTPAAIVTQTGESYPLISVPVQAWPYPQRMPGPNDYPPGSPWAKCGGGGGCGSCGSGSRSGCSSCGHNGSGGCLWQNGTCRCYEPKIWNWFRWNETNDPCNTMHCTCPRCIFRFQFGSCSAFFSECQYDPNRLYFDNP
jgi:hypothetical protein